MQLYCGRGEANQIGDVSVINNLVEKLLIRFLAQLAKRWHVWRAVVHRLLRRRRRRRKASTYCRSATLMNAHQALRRVQPYTCAMRRRVYRQVTAVSLELWDASLGGSEYSIKLWRLKWRRVPCEQQLNMVQFLVVQPSRGWAGREHIFTAPICGPM